MIRWGVTGASERRSEDARGFFGDTDRGSEGAHDMRGDGGQSKRTEGMGDDEHQRRPLPRWLFLFKMDGEDKRLKISRRRLMFVQHGHMIHVT